jgi:hypothetical protein
MSAQERLAQLTNWVEGTLSEARRTAASAPRGGDQRWIGLLRDLGVEPLSDAERARHLAQGSPIENGALPMEYRWALEAIERRASSTCREIDMALEPEDEATQRAVDKLAHRLNLLVDEELRRYMSSVRPTITTSSIFANAMATSQRILHHPQAASAGVSTTQCPCCGAPRQQGCESMVCEFCGSSLA